MRPDSTDARCPGCGRAGRRVSDKTVWALLEPTVATSLLVVERRFCRTPRCDVLYYGADGRVVPKSASRVRVGLKETRDPVPLCYCLGFERADVRREIAQAGHCAIPARIIAKVRAGRTACEVRNPAGACCLGEVNRAVQEITNGRSLPWRGAPRQKVIWLGLSAVALCCGSHTCPFLARGLAWPLCGDSPGAGPGSSDVALLLPLLVIAAAIFLLRRRR